MAGKREIQRTLKTLEVCDEHKALSVFVWSILKETNETSDSDVKFKSSRLSDTWEYEQGIQYGLNRLEAFSFSTFALSSSHFLFSSISSIGWQ